MKATISTNRLNPYKIMWAVEVMKNGKVKFNHYPSIEKLKESIKPNYGSTVYAITDKQFGYIANDWVGNEPKLQINASHKIVIKDKKFTQVIPLTKNQFENPVYAN